MNNQLRVIVLWGLFLLGLTFHSLLEFMPLFFGVNIAMSGATGSMPGWMNWVFLSFYLIPMICITIALFISSKWYKIINLIFAALFTFFNVYHLVEHTSEGMGVQPVLLTYIFIASVLLTLVSYRWLKE